MNAAVRFIAALFVGLSALVVEADSQDLFTWFYILPDGTYVEDINNEWITPENGLIESGKPDQSVEFAVNVPLNSGLRVQHWIMARDMPSEDVEERDPTEVKMLSSYSDTLSVSWNVNRYFDTGYVYVGVRFYYITNSVAFNRGASDATGSTAPILNQCYTNSYALTPNGFSRTGYAFANWTNDAGVVHSDGETVSGSILGVTNNMQTVDLYAVWSPNTNDVSYALDGGSYGSSHPSSATYDVPFEVSDPTRTGYTFDGWKVTGGLDTGSGAAPQYSADGETWSSVSSASMLCKGANGSTWFKNLNPANGAAVTLSAQWTPKTTAVHFNNYDASSGAADKVLTYGDALQSVQVAVWNNGSKTFLGYYTGEGGTGECYWDASGQPMKGAWDIEDASITLYAHTSARVYYITYEPNGGAGEHFSVPFTNGTAITLSDGAVFSRQGSELLGWARLSTVGTPEYQLGKEVVLSGEAANFNLYAIWQDFYYVAFDGNGATNETPMAVQKFAFGESKALDANEYGKVGYEFFGWATNGAAAAIQDISYADLQVVKNIAKSAGETNTLFASWHPISYVTAFDASKHSSVDIAPSNCIYDVEFPLPVIPYVDGELWKHVGWSNALENVVYYTNEVSFVSNLCTTAGATNTLVAAWASMVGELSEAMDIYDLVWRNMNSGSDQIWRVAHGIGYDTGSCAAQTGKPSGRNYWAMTTSVTNSGTLTFWWKSTGTASLYYSDKQTGRSDQEFTFAAQSDWTRVSIEVEFLSGGANTCTLRLAPSTSNKSDTDTIYIDRMTWTPKGSSVEPTPADARDISGISFDGGVLSLSFTNADERFSYNLRGTNDLVAPLALWPVLWTTNGTGRITITPPLVPSAPQFFYYLETTAK